MVVEWESTAVREKKLAFKKWQSEGTEEAHKQYREKSKQAKIMEAMAKNRAWKEWIESLLQWNEERTKMFKVASR